MNTKASKPPARDPIVIAFRLMGLLLAVLAAVGALWTTDRARRIDAMPVVSAHIVDVKKTTETKDNQVDERYQPTYRYTTIDGKEHTAVSRTSYNSTSGIKTGSQVLIRLEPGGVASRATDLDHWIFAGVLWLVCAGLVVVSLSPGRGSAGKKQADADHDPEN